jgi:hypothetical protein
MNPDKDLETKLKELEKKSKYAPLREVSQKIRQGIYEENDKQLKKNKKNLTKKVNKWKKKIEKGDEKDVKTYLGKFEFGQGLLDLLQGKKGKPQESIESKETEQEKAKATEKAKESDEKEKQKEEYFALKKKIGEAATSPEEPSINVKLSKLALLAEPLEKSIANSITKTDEYKVSFEDATTEFKKGNFEEPKDTEIDQIKIQAMANAARSFQALQGQLDVYPVVQKPTLTTGDCFYSAIYRSAKERGYLEDFVECLGLDITDEKKFIQSLRNVIADEILNDHLPGTKTREGFLDAYDFLLQNYADSPEMYKTIIRGFPYWFQKKFANGPGEKKAFLKELATHTMTMTQWVGEIEFKIAQRLFKSYCGVELQSHYVSRDYNSNDEEKMIELPKIYNGVPVFHLVNLGEAHYEYYSFKIPMSKIKKAKSDIVKTKATEEPCGLIVYDPCTGMPIMEGDPVTIIQNRLKTIQSRAKKGGTRKRK